MTTFTITEANYGAAVKLIKEAQMRIARELNFALPGRSTNLRSVNELLTASLDCLTREQTAAISQVEA